MYGRQITPNRLGRLLVLSPEKFTPKGLTYKELSHSQTPRRTDSSYRVHETQTKPFQITELFNLERGHFHAIDRLKEGTYPTVSRTAEDNGITGFHEKPKRAAVFQKFTLTISTVTGDAFLQFYPFIATDNVVMCLPKKQLRLTTLAYVQTAIRKVKWRYSYGRQAYKRVLSKTVLFLHVNSEGNIDEDYIEGLVTRQPYWKAFLEKAKTIPET